MCILYLSLTLPKTINSHSGTQCLGQEKISFSQKLSERLEMGIYFVNMCMDPDGGGKQHYDTEE